MKSYRFGEPKTFVDDISDEDLAGNVIIDQTYGSGFTRSKFYLKSILLGMVMGGALCYLLKK